VESRVDDRQLVVLPQKRLRVVRTKLDIVAPPHIRDIGMYPGVGERTVLSNGLVLDWPGIGQRIAARIVVVLVSSDVRPEVEDGVASDGVGIGGGNVEGPDLR